MAKFGPTEILLALLATLLLVIVSGMALAWAWVIRRLVTGQEILPPHPIVSRPETPWGAWTVLLAVIVYVLVYLAVAQGYAWATGRAPAKRPPVPPKAATPDQQDVEKAKTAFAADPAQVQSEQPRAAPGQGLEPRPQEAATPVSNQPKGGTAPAARAAPRSSEEIFTMTEMMAVSAIAETALLVLLPLLVRVTSGARFRDFGLSWEGWERQVAVGVVAALLAAPAVYGIQHVATRIWLTWEKHPVHKMVEDEFSVGVADLAILTAIVVAPIFEELMFRAILQNWLVCSLGRRPRPTTFSPEAEDSEFEKPEPPSAPVHQTAEIGRSQVCHFEPTAARMPASPRHRRSGSAAIILTSLIFGAVHAPQWPAPIALFVLALVIGTVYHRTGSLIAAICMHASFNAFSTTALLISLLLGDAIEPKKVPVVGKPPVASAQFIPSISHPGDH